MKLVRRLTPLVAFACMLSLGQLDRSAHADVRLPHLFGDHMVLQRDMPVRVWGTADAGEKVTVAIGDHSASATADDKGKWKVELPALSVGDPIELKVNGKNAITLHDVLVGEVWVCSGQSNMEWPVERAVNGADEIAKADHGKIRLFHVPKLASPKPLDDVDAQWRVCTPGSVGKFSAVAYFFGQHLNQELGVPVGLINTSWGGTLIEPWTPPEGFRAVPAVTSILDALPKQNAAGGGKPLAEGKAAKKAERKGKKGAKAAPSAQAPHGTATYLYNGMVHPLLPFAIRGAIWYQGESNLSDAMVYHEKMKALIAGWRAVWHQGDFPFYFVQLASFNYGKNNPTALPRLWEAQTATLTVPNTGMAVTMDIANVADIHPTNKQDVGKRLALWALAKTYGKDSVVYSGPLFQSMDVEGSAIRLKFDHVGGGLVARDGKPLAGFTIAGEDKKFVDAEAKIDGDAIVVSSPKVEKPIAVRFAWDQLSQPNLANKAGLPASSFRTDHWEN